MSISTTLAVAGMMLVSLPCTLTTVALPVLCPSAAGGFSVYAGVGGAAHVTTVDIGRAALSYADANWRLNGLDPAAHVSAAVDAFEFLDGASKAREK